jgi:hypothetical protein
MLNIDTSITYKGVTVSGALLVINALVKKTATGNELVAALDGVYASEAARAADPIGNKLESAFPQYVSRAYDRETESADVLQLAHEQYRGWLIDADLGGFGAESVTIIGLDA